MKTLSKKEKEIIRLMRDKKIYDIYSYVEFYRLYDDIQYREKDVADKFKKVFGGKQYECHLSNQTGDSVRKYDNIVKEIDNQTVIAKPRLSYMGSKFQSVENYNYNLFMPIRVSKDIESILHFIAVWEYLLSEGLIIQLPKTCEQQDVALFLRQEYIERKDEICPEDIFDSDTIEYSDMNILADFFMDWRLKLDEKDFKICKPYLQKRIYPTLGLDVYIKKGFKTKNDISERRNFLIAFVGVVVAIVTSAVSVWLSISNKGYSTELNNINNSIQEMQEKIPTSLGDIEAIQRPK